MEVLHRKSLPAACKIPLPISCVYRQFYEKYSVLFHGTYHTSVVVLRIEHNRPVKCQPSAGLSFSQTLEQDPAMKPSVAKRGEAKFLQQQLLESCFRARREEKGRRIFFTPLPPPSFLLMQPSSGVFLFPFFEHRSPAHSHDRSPGKSAPTPPPLASSQALTWAGVMPGFLRAFCVGGEIVRRR